MRMAKVGIYVVGRMWALDLVPSWQTTKALTHGLSLDLRLRAWLLVPRGNMPRDRKEKL